MKYFNYFLQFLFVMFFFSLFRILGLNFSSKIGGKLFEKIGPLFRSKKLIQKNIRRALPNVSEENLNKIVRLMWNNYGRVFGEYLFIKDFRNGKYNSNIKIEGQDILEKIKKTQQQVIFVSGHLGNFELMAMHLEKTGIKLSTIYRPLNNIFLNPLMEKIRKKYICKNQIKKGISGTKETLKFFKNNTSIALMIDQRVSEGIKSKLFNEDAFTTTIPAQFVKKFNCIVQPVYIERIDGINFKIIFDQQINFDKNQTIEYITEKLNKWLEIKISKNPDQWIWTHNRWKR